MIADAPYWGHWLRSGFGNEEQNFYPYYLAVFAGILFMALVANEAVFRFRPTNPTPWFVGLLAAVVLLWAVPPSALTALPVVTRGVLGGLVNGLPVAFAGVIVSILLARSRNAAASLGSNLLGSVVGGCLEYLSMVAGLRALALLALALYLGALLVALRRGAAAAVAPADATPSEAAES